MPSFWLLIRLTTRVDLGGVGFCGLEGCRCETSPTYRHRPQTRVPHQYQFEVTNQPVHPMAIQWAMVPRRARSTKKRAPQAPAMEQESTASKATLRSPDRLY